MQANGVTTEDCYPYNSMFTGDSYDCLSTCINGTAITQLYKAGYTNLTSSDSVKDFLLYNGPAIVLIEGNNYLIFR